MKKNNVIQTNPPSDCILRWAGESELDYFVRLFENKTKYGLSSKDVADLLNNEFGTSYDESTYRKKFADFNRGRIYERECGTQQVNQRILAVSDFHVPFHLPIDTFKGYANNIDLLIINGDLLDCQSISKFSKKYRINLIDEMIEARQYIMDLIDMLYPKKVIFVKGNHEHRLLSYLTDKLNEDLLNIMPDSPLDLIINDGFKNRDRFNKTEVFYQPLVEVYNGRDIEIIYNGDWWYMCGNVIFAHPLAYSSSILKTTEKAVSYFAHQNNTKHFTSVILGHTHRVGFYKIGDIRMYEQGCCCKTEKLDYADGKLQSPQQKGFMYIALDNNGDIIENKTQLISID